MSCVKIRVELVAGRVFNEKTQVNQRCQTLPSLGFDDCAFLVWASTILFSLVWASTILPSLVWASTLSFGFDIFLFPKRFQRVLHALGRIQHS